MLAKHDMPIRSAGAQHLHTTIFSYFQTGEKSYYEEISSLLQGKNRSPIIETSANGFTHVHDIFHFSFPELHSEDIAKRRRALFSVFMQYCQSQEKVFLLTQVNNEGFTPLHGALITGQPGMLTAYLEAVRGCLIDKTLDAQRFVELLVGANQSGFMPLHSALKAGDPGKLTAYLEAVRGCLIDKTLDAQRFVQLLVGANQSGFTPLHQALITGQPEIVQCLLALIKEHGSEQQLQQALCAENRSGFNGLHQAANSGNLAVVNLFIGAVREAFTQDADTVLQKLATNKTKQGFKPSCSKRTADKDAINTLMAQCSGNVMESSNKARFFQSSAVDSRSDRRDDSRERKRDRKDDERSRSDHRDDSRQSKRGRAEEGGSRSAYKERSRHVNQYGQGDEVSRSDRDASSRHDSKRAKPEESGSYRSHHHHRPF